MHDGTDKNEEINDEASGDRMTSPRKDAIMSTRSRPAILFQPVRPNLQRWETGKSLRDAYRFRKLPALSRAVEYPAKNPPPVQTDCHECLRHPCPVDSAKPLRCSAPVHSPERQKSCARQVVDNVAGLPAQAAGSPRTRKAARPDLPSPPASG